MLSVKIAIFSRIAPFHFHNPSKFFVSSVNYLRRTELFRTFALRFRQIRGIGYATDDRPTTDRRRNGRPIEPTDSESNRMTGGESHGTGESHGRIED